MVIKLKLAGRYDVYQGSWRVASIHKTTSTEREAELAHLLTAAPELLEALREARSYVRLYQSECGPCADTAKVETQIEAAIAKALGQSDLV